MKRQSSIKCLLHKWPQDSPEVAIKYWLIVVTVLLLTCRCVGVPPRQTKQVHFVRNDGAKRRRRRRSSDSALKVASARIIVSCLGVSLFLCKVLVKILSQRRSSLHSTLLYKTPPPPSHSGFKSSSHACALMRPRPDHLIRRLEIEVRRRNGFTGSERCLMSGFWLLTLPSGYSGGTRVRRGLLMKCWEEEEIRYG